MSNIVLSYQNSAPQSFQNGMQAAANILDSLILNNITANIQVTYAIPPSAPARRAAITVPYSTLRAVTEFAWNIDSYSSRAERFPCP